MKIESELETSKNAFKQVAVDTEARVQTLREEVTLTLTLTLTRVQTLREEVTRWNICPFPNANPDNDPNLKVERERNLTEHQKALVHQHEREMGLEKEERRLAINRAVQEKLEV